MTGLKGGVEVNAQRRTVRTGYVVGDVYHMVLFQLAGHQIYFVVETIAGTKTGVYATLRTYFDHWSNVTPT